MNSGKSIESIRKLNSSSLHTQLDLISRSNCSDLELSYRTCLKSLSFDRFLYFCDQKHSDWMGCVKRQRDILDDLHQNGTKLNDLAEKADQIYLDKK